MSLAVAIIAAPNLFIGAGGFGYGCGSNSPAVQQPFGMLRLGPDTAPAFKKLYARFQHYGGYSFGDYHINEIIFQALRSNKRLAITAFLYGDVDENKNRRTDLTVLNYGKDNPNLSIIGPDQACISGIIAGWDDKENSLETMPFWNEKNKIVEAGDFKIFTEYLKGNFNAIPPRTLD